MNEAGNRATDPCFLDLFALIVLLDISTETRPMRRDVWYAGEEATFADLGRRAVGRLATS